MTDADFFIEYKNFLARAITLCEKACKEGLLSLEELIDEEKFIQRDIFELGIYLVIQAIDEEIIFSVLSNIVDQEKDKNMKTLKTIKLEAVSAFQKGLHPSKLFLLLNSHVSIDIESSMKKYKELAKKQYGGKN